ncbi:histidinol-phosphate transaminase [Ottowia testudinis]|uniref:Histidinol-phosphate aminotransferase n=1 Tax=Ottowia testudinis TaxID=2816950 RepID=A0A975CH27_9BURK|nr:histidinol-phosphate transaminase [Ottowia testudinis]QTD46075.1 histidinol-phosphate transaminase [Ottowia testudinis]
MTPATARNTEPLSPLARIRHDVQSMHAYAVQDAAGLLKMDAMENPHRLPAALQAELGLRLGAVAINRYPGACVDELKAALNDHAAPPPGWSLMLGNGSDELISLLALACDVPGASILAPVPGFVMYALSAQLQGLAFHGVPLTADFALDEAAMLAAIAQHRPAIVYLAYPNNPTGTLWDAAVIERLIAAQGAQGGLVVMDEAYQPFAARSWIDNVRAAPDRHGHVLVMRTLSKFGLAGVRIGYLMGDAALIGQIDKVRPPYNISVLNAECALFALEHADVFAAQALDIQAQRALLFEALGQLPGVTAYPSQGNMILVRVPDAARVFSGMKARHVLIKNVSTMHPLLDNCVRLTVGTAEENAQMLAALQASL